MFSYPFPFSVFCISASLIVPRKKRNIPMKTALFSHIFPFYSCNFPAIFVITSNFKVILLIFRQKIPSAYFHFSTVFNQIHPEIPLYRCFLHLNFSENPHRRQKFSVIRRVSHSFITANSFHFSKKYEHFYLRFCPMKRALACLSRLQPQAAVVIFQQGLFGHTLSLRNRKFFR